MAYNETPEAIGRRLRRRFAFLIHLMLSIPTFFWLLQMVSAGDATDPNPLYWQPAPFFAAVIVILLLVHLIHFTRMEMLERITPQEDDSPIAAPQPDPAPVRRDVSIFLDGAGELVEADIDEGEYDYYQNGVRG